MIISPFAPQYVAYRLRMRSRHPPSDTNRAGGGPQSMPRPATLKKKNSREAMLAQKKPDELTSKCVCSLIPHFVLRFRETLTCMLYPGMSSW
jgi:hypothetical protein